MNRPLQPIFKDLDGYRKAQLQNFIFNPKAADPVGGDRTPQESYINTTDKLVKYFDDNLDLRYSVPGIVKAIAPTTADINYPLGTEWTLDDGSETWKLLEVDSAGEAYWLKLKGLEPLTLVTANQQFYVDFDSGIDTNKGTSAEPFKTIAGAIAVINSTYDFDNGKYNYTINVVSTTQPFGLTRVDAPVGATKQAFTITGVAPETELVMSSANGFIFGTELEVNIQNFRFTANTPRTTCINGSKGRCTLKNNTFTGQIIRPITLGRTFRVRSTAENCIENLVATNFLRSSYRSDYYQTAAFVAKGTNTFSEDIFSLSDSSIAYLTDSASLALDTSATVTGQRFTKYGNSTLRISAIDQLSAWGDIPGNWYGSGLYRSRIFNHNYSHLVEGLAISLASPTELTLSLGEAMILKAQGDKAGQYWNVNVFPDQTIAFPTILATQNEAWVYATEQETIEFLAAPPDPVNLEFRVCLGKVTTSDNATFDSVQAQITERSPEFLDSLAIPGTIDSCSVSNLATNTLNNTIAGETIPLDSLTFSTSSPSAYTLVGDSIRVEQAGIYKIEQDLNCSVPTNGTQRPSVGIRIAINGIQRMKTGRSGYIRRAGGHYRSSSIVTARVVLNAGDLVSGLGFRDSAGGVVDCAAGESELFLMKMS